MIVTSTPRGNTPIRKHDVTGTDGTIEFELPQSHDRHQDDPLEVDKLQGRSNSESARHAHNRVVRVITLLGVCVALLPTWPTIGVINGLTRALHAMHALLRIE